MMYSDDTFFHLSIPGQIGLAILSALLCIITVWIFHKTSSRFGLLVKVLLAIVFLWTFTWVSPQIYYLYYWVIFDGLPLQSVIQTPPSVAEILAYITFSGEQNLSAHSKGVLFWILIFVAVWKKYQDKRP